MSPLLVFLTALWLVATVTVIVWPTDATPPHRDLNDNACMVGAR